MPSPLQQKSERLAQEREHRGIPRCTANVSQCGAWEPHRCYKGAVADYFCGSHHPDRQKATLKRKLDHAILLLKSNGYTVTKENHHGSAAPARN